MSTQFYITENDLGKNRAAVSGPKIAELNVYTAIDVKTDTLSEINFDIYFAEYTV
jgi:molybdopterin/thiamine biosynthesis adenylyltransferase